MFNILKALGKALVFTLSAIAFLFIACVMFIALLLWLEDLMIIVCIAITAGFVLLIFWEAYKWEKEKLDET